jgi:N-acyl-L-homoserine lactone synthetase
MNLLLVRCAEVLIPVFMPINQKFSFRAYHAPANRDVCMQFLAGHVKVLKDYGITNITTNTQEWMDWHCVWLIVALNELGEVQGGIRVHMADGEHLLPVEKAIGKIDPKIHEIVEQYRHEGVGELCALWNSKEVAGAGLSMLLTRAGISIVNQVGIKTLMGICADYTLKMFSRVGFVVDKSLGNGGDFVYPNENYIARVLGILNASDLSTAEPYDRERMLSLRNQPNQIFMEEGPKGSELEVNYHLFPILRATKSDV